MRKISVLAVAMAMSLPVAMSGDRADAKVFRSISVAKSIAAPGGGDRDIVVFMPDARELPSGAARVVLTPSAPGAMTLILYTPDLQELARARTTQGEPVEVSTPIDPNSRSGLFSASPSYLIRVVTTGGAFDYPVGKKAGSKGLPGVTSTTVLAPYRLEIRDAAGLSPPAETAEAAPGAPRPAPTAPAPYAAPSPVPVPMPVAVATKPYGDLSTYIFQKTPDGASYLPAVFTGKQTLGKRNRGTYYVRFGFVRDKKGVLMLEERWLDTDWGVIAFYWAQMDGQPNMYERTDFYHSNEFAVQPDGRMLGRGRLRNENQLTRRLMSYKRVGGNLVLTLYKSSDDALSEPVEQYILTQASTDVYAPAVTAFNERKAAKKSDGGSGIGGMLAGAVIGGALTGGSAEGIMAGAQAFAPNDAVRAQLADQQQDMATQRQREEQQEAAFQRQLAETVRNAEAQRQAAQPQQPSRAQANANANGPAPRPGAAITVASAPPPPPAPAPAPPPKPVVQAPETRYFGCVSIRRAQDEKHIVYVESMSYGVVTSTHETHDVLQRFKGQTFATASIDSENGSGSCMPFQTLSEAASHVQIFVDRDRKGNFKMNTDVNFTY